MHRSSTFTAQNHFPGIGNKVKPASAAPICDFSQAQIGDKAFHIKHGECQILRIAPFSQRPVLFRFKCGGYGSSQFDGKECSGDLMPSYYPARPEITVPDVSAAPEKAPMGSNQAIVIYGPQGCGKSLLAPIFAAYYGKSKIYDNGKTPDVFDNDTLMLTNNEAVPGAIDFYEALLEIQPMLSKKLNPDLQTTYHFS